MELCGGLHLPASVHNPPKRGFAQCRRGAGLPVEGGVEGLVPSAAGVEFRTEA